MRWLLGKDLALLRRSPLITGSLVAYPIALAILIGFAVSRDASEPRVGFANLVPPDARVVVGGEEFDRDQVRDQFCAEVECIEVETREQAAELVRDAEVLGAVVLPPELGDQINSLQSLDPERPTVEVLVNVEDPLKGQIIDDRIDALLTEANLRLSRDITEQAVDYLGLIVTGGSFQLFGNSFEILGLDRSEAILERAAGSLPRGSVLRVGILRVLEFTRLAADNLDFADDLLAVVSRPISARKTIVTGDSPPLDIYAISVAATVTLMFVTVLLVAGALALEREENVFVRLTGGGMISRTGLLGEKIGLGVVIAAVVTLLMLAGVETFVDLNWGRIGLWVVAMVAAGLGFAAFGAAIGTLSREVRAASLLAFMLSLPIALISLIPSGAVGPTAFDIIEAVAAAFPFDPALRALSGALDPAGPSVGGAALHLGLLTLVYGGIARIALNRLAH